MTDFFSFPFLFTNRGSSGSTRSRSTAGRAAQAQPDPRYFRRASPFDHPFFTTPLFATDGDFLPRRSEMPPQTVRIEEINGSDDDVVEIPPPSQRHHTAHTPHRTERPRRGQPEPYSYSVAHRVEEPMDIPFESDSSTPQQPQESHDMLDHKHTEENEPKPVAWPQSRNQKQPLPAPGPVSQQSTTSEPTLNLTEDADNYILTYSLPGFPAAQIKLEVQVPGEEEEEGQDSLLCVSAERKTPNGGTIPFSSTLAIPVEVPPNAINAKYFEDTQTLIITIPKARVRVVPINIQTAKRSA